MPSPPCIPIDDLLEPIGGKFAPVGEALRFTSEGLAFDKARKGDVDVNNKPVPPNPAEQAQLAIRFLKSKGKDIEVAAYLLDALSQSHGVVGLRDGLTLIRRLLTECDDRLLPEAVDSRGVRIKILTDKAGGWRFPVQLTLRPLIPKYPKLTIAASTASLDEFKAIAAKIEREELARAAEDARLALEEITEIDKYFAGKFAADAELEPDDRPSLESLRSFLETTAGLLGHVSGGAADPAEASDAEVSSAGEPTAGAPAPRPAAKAVYTRDDAYRELADLADRFARVDAHSPVPLMLKLLVRLKDLPFYKVVDELQNSSSVFEYLRKIEEEPAPG